MYMRPNTLAPAPGTSNSHPPQHQQHRFYELLDALKMEYDLTAQGSGNGGESGNKMALNDYESKGKEEWLY